METNTDQPVVLSHGFTPWITVESDADGKNPVLAFIDFADSHVDTSVKYGGQADMTLGGEAGEFLDSIIPQIEEAIFLIASGYKLVVDRGTSADGRSLYGCLWTSDARHIENDGGPCEICGEDY